MERVVRLILTSGLIGFFPILLFGQLIVNPIAPADAVQNILLGTGVTVSNISYTGHTESIGQFTSSSTNLGLEKGLILSTGKTIRAAGSASLQASSNNNQPGDGMLTSLAGARTNDAVVLSFDFIPTSDSIIFSYVFASEEYPNYVGHFNDVFAFFITGEGFSGWQNIAIIPGTDNIPVSINNVNAGKNSEYYRNNQGGAYIRYNAFTKVLEARAKVVPCSKYTLRLSIADAVDFSFDSGVFLEARSLKSESISVVTSKFEILEGFCDSSKVTIKRKNSVNTSAIVKIEKSGNAADGNDYTGIPNQIYFPAGIDTVSFFVKAVYDKTIEADEMIELNFKLQTSCMNSDFPFTKTITIKNSQESIGLKTNNDTVICFSSCIYLNANSSISDTNHVTYTWNNGLGNGREHHLHPEKSIIYQVIAHDVCHNAYDTAEVNIQVKEPLSVSITEDTTICYGQTIKLEAVGKGGITSGYQFKWNPLISKNSSMIVTPLKSSVYVVTLSDNCSAPVSAKVSVNVTPKLGIEKSADVSICENGSTELAVVSFGGSGAPHILTWDNSEATGNSYFVKPENSRYIQVKLEDGCSTPARDSIYVKVEKYPVIDFKPAREIICVNDSTSFLNNSVFESGSRFKWMINYAAAGIEENLNSHFSKAGKYNISLNISTPAGCRSELTKENIIEVKDLPKVDFEVDKKETNILNPEFKFTNLSSNTQVSYSWEMGDGSYRNSNDLRHQYNDTGSYIVSLKAVSEYGCAMVKETEVRVKDYYQIYIPNAFSPLDQNGTNDIFKAEGTGLLKVNMQIFNRWGQLVYESNGDGPTYWNGKMHNQGELLDAGVYTYMIQVNDFEKGQHFYNGTVTLVP